MTLIEQLDRLAALEPVPYPVISLYLNTQPDDRGRDHFHSFVRKELKARAETYPAGSAEREMLDRDLERITSFLATGIRSRGMRRTTRDTPRWSPARTSRASW